MAILTDRGIAERKVKLNINGISTGYYQAGYTNNKAAQTVQGAGFSNQLNNTVNRTPSLTLYGSVDGETGDTVIGAWVNAQSGISTTVYKPQDFDENNPVYRVKIWDADGNLMEERMVNASEIDPRRSDSFDMYAYACHLSDSGEYPDAMLRFMMTHAQYEGSQTNFTGENMFDKLDWLSILKDIMEMQYKLGNLEGYMNYKSFLDVLQK